MVTKLKKTLQSDKISSVRRRQPVCVEQGTPLKMVLAQMRKNKRGCAIVMKNEKIVGIFTERDLLNRVIGAGKKKTIPIEEVMTPNPTVLNLDHSVLDVILLMSKNSYRHLPLVDSQGKIQGFISIRDVIDYLAEHFPYQIYNLPPDPMQVNKAADGA